MLLFLHKYRLKRYHKNVASTSFYSFYAKIINLLISPYYQRTPEIIMMLFSCFIIVKEVLHLFPPKWTATWSSLEFTADICNIFAGNKIVWMQLGSMYFKKTYVEINARFGSDYSTVFLITTYVTMIQNTKGSGVVWIII